MRDVDVAIVGSGLAGSTTAAMLGKAGYSVAVVDPHAAYPADFRCEKLDGMQVAVLRKTGLADAVLRASTLDGEVWVARYGRLVEKKPSDQEGILYHDLVNAVRGEIPDSVARYKGKVSAIATSADRQRVTLSTGEEIGARLVVVANGLNAALRHAVLDMPREVLTECISITIGFDLMPVGRPSFEFRALTYYPERCSRRMAYLTLFPIGSVMRANLMVYRTMDDPWLSRMRHQPNDAMRELMPKLHPITGDYEVDEAVKIRPADLYVTKNYRRAGVVLVGDAFGTSCPAAGTGTLKVFNDVERLCNVHVPRWLETPGMGEEKVAAFYDDPEKQAIDRYSTEKAYFLRSLSVDPSLPWRIRRDMRFAAGLGAGLVREAGRRFSFGAPERGQPAAGFRKSA